MSEWKIELEYERGRENQCPNEKVGERESEIDGFRVRWIKTEWERETEKCSENERGTKEKCQKRWRQ